METRIIKKEKIDKYLSALREMKYRADNNLAMKINMIIEKYHINNSISYFAKLIGYFECNYNDKWFCKKESFEPIDARKIINSIYWYQKKLAQKRDKKGKFLTGNIPHNKPEELYESDNKIQKKQIEFVPPLTQHVRDYCKLRGNDIDPEEFVSYYVSRDWMVGKNKMKNWKMAINTWERNQKRPNIVYVTKISEYSDDELIGELKKRGYKGGIQKDIIF